MFGMFVYFFVSYVFIFFFFALLQSLWEKPSRWRTP